MNSIQGGSGPIKKPASAGFNVIGSRDSVAYPFLSPHRLVGGKRLVRTVLIFTESSDQLSRATDRVPGLPASPGYV
ncbi:hypothetical protein FCY34_13590, partial [Escherichia coli]|nr:hypothetical protein [Escherichia coli]